MAIHVVVKRRGLYVEFRGNGGECQLIVALPIAHSGGCFDDFVQMQRRTACRSTRHGGPPKTGALHARGLPSVSVQRDRRLVRVQQQCGSAGGQQVCEPRRVQWEGAMSATLQKENTKVRRGPLANLRRK